MVDDHGTLLPVGEERMAISRFKATCLAVLERVRRTRQPLTVTKRGNPIARVVPIEPSLPADRATFGALAGRGRELGDIVAPAGEPQEWDSLR